jgi:hypothetical protein
MRLADAPFLFSDPSTSCEGDYDRLPGLDRFERSRYRVDEGQEILQLIGPRPDQDNREAAAYGRMLEWDPLIDRQ